MPDSIRSDNGPQFIASEYREFAQSFGFETVTSSPHFPQSNGVAERAVQTAKSILQQKDPDVAILNFRNTKHSSIGTSPAEALMGRKLKGRVPILTKLLAPAAGDRDSLVTNDKAAKDRYKQAYDRRHGAKPLTPLIPGDNVLVKTDDQKSWAVPSTVIESAPVHRPPLVATARLVGTARRNRKHLQKVPALPAQLPAEEPEEPVLLDVPGQPKAPDQEVLLSQESPTPTKRMSQRVRVKTRRLIAEM